MNLRVCIKATECKPKEITKVQIKEILVFIENDKNGACKLRNLGKLRHLFKMTSFCHPWVLQSLIQVFLLDLIWQSQREFLEKKIQLNVYEYEHQ